MKSFFIDEDHAARARLVSLRRTEATIAASPPWSTPAAPRRLLVKSGSRVVFVNVHDVDWVKAEGNYARLHTSGVSHLIRATMSHLETRLGASLFARIHRSFIARTDSIRELQLRADGDYEAVLGDGTRLKIGRRYRRRLQHRLLGG